MDTGDIFCEEDFTSFQELVYKSFYGLSLSASHEFLTLQWIANLLDAFEKCQEKFIEILCNYRANVSIPPLVSSITTRYLTNCKISLDIWNNSQNALHKIRKCKKQLQNLIRHVDRQQTLETRNTLQEMSRIIEDDENGSVPCHDRFFNGPDSTQHPNPNSAYETLRFIAMNQIQLEWTGSDSAERLAATIFTMGFTLMFVMWVLNAALPCTYRTAENLFTVPREFNWGELLNIIQGRIIEKSNKEERRHTKGLMKEIGEIEKSVQLITDSMISENWPVGLEKRWIVSDRIHEIMKVDQDCIQRLHIVEEHLRYLFFVIWTCIFQVSDWLIFQSRRS